MVVHLFGFIGMIIIFIMMINVPESPKFYYLKERYDEARNVLLLIADKNKADLNIAEIEFDGEL